jgi:nucleoside-diphosphate-sugar epimerase
MNQKKILITGANGFLGRACTQYFSEYTIHGAVRKDPGDFPPNIFVFPNCDLSSLTDWSKALEGVDYVIHCGARVHVMKDTSKDPLQEFRKVNVDGTLAFAQQAADKGVKRFIFISTIKVNGEETQDGKRYTASDVPNPSDPYGISKYEAEIGLQAISQETGMELVIIRPPLIYGPGVKGNFESMMALIKLGLPLPLGGIKNKRSMVSVGNLLSLIRVCLTHDNAPGQVFLVSDNHDVSTSDLIKICASTMGRKLCLFYASPWLLHGVCRLIRKPQVSERLLGSLQVDIQETIEVLGWTPPLTLQEGFGFMGDK